MEELYIKRKNNRQRVSKLNVCNLCSYHIYIYIYIQYVITKRVCRCTYIICQCPELDTLDKGVTSGYIVMRATAPPPPQGEVELDSPRGKEGAFPTTSTRTERER